MTGFATAFSEITLVLFTTLAPSGAVAYVIMGMASLHARGDERRRVSAVLLAPFLVALVGLVASATHLGNPDNALYVFSRVGESPLSNEVCAAVLFLGASGLHWLYQFAEHARSYVQNTLLGAAIVAAFAFLVSVAFAYATETVITWNTPFVPAALCLNALVGGPVLAFAGLRFSCWTPLAGRAGVALLMSSLVALMANVGVYVAQGADVLAMRNYLVSADQLVPAYGAMVFAFCLFSVAGLAVDAVEIWRGRSISKPSVVAASVLVFIGIFVMRFAFYMMHMTYGISL